MNTKATKGNPKVDAFFRATKEWREESVKLRAIILDFPLTEELKWNKPCYSHEGSNLLIIQAFKEYCYRAHVLQRRFAEGCPTASSSSPG